MVCRFKVFCSSSFPQPKHPNSVHRIQFRLQRFTELCDSVSGLEASGLMTSWGRALVEFCRAAMVAGIAKNQQPAQQLFFCLVLVQHHGPVSPANSGQHKKRRPPLQGGNVGSLYSTFWPESPTFSNPTKHMNRRNIYIYNIYIYIKMNHNYIRNTYIV